MKRAGCRRNRAGSADSGADGIVLLKHDGLGVDPNALGGVVSFVDADETVSDLKHVVPQGDDDELSILRLFLQRQTYPETFNPPRLQIISPRLEASAHSRRCNKPQWRHF